jgi:hypothetical protein
MSSRVLSVLLVGLLGACTASIGPKQGAGEPAAAGSAAGGGAGFVPGAPAPAAFSCDGAAVPDELPLPRLSHGELERTLRFALELALPSDAQAIWTGLGPTLARLPADLRTAAPGDLKGGYGRADQAIQQTQIDAVFEVARALAKELTSSPNRIAAMLGGCATDDSTANDRACLEGFVQSWGSRVMRYPLGTDDVAFFADAAGSTPVAPEALADVLVVILNAPETLYFVAHGSDDASAVAPLSPFELAARLSYQFWQRPPDDALWEAARSGALLDEAGYAAELERLVRAAGLGSSLDEWVTEWLRLDELPPLDALASDASFVAFAGADLPSSSARDSMIQDVLASARSTAENSGSVSDFLNDRHSYASDDYLARIYAAPVWSGDGPAPLFGSAKRAGLLTRAALLATGTVATRPIHKGYLVRNALLCQQVGAPPANADVTPPVSSGNMTTRDAVTQKTSGGVCGACHLTRINPAGFLTENFDALGRERTEERVFDAQGNVVASFPIDTQAVPEIWPGDARSMSDAVALTQAIDEARLFHSCLALHYFRFSQRRYESLPSDGCVLASIEAKARAGAPLTEVLKTFALAPTFKTRRFQ